MSFAWVIGSGGLLGAALCRALRSDGTGLFVPPQRFAWDDEEALALNFSAAVSAFGMLARNAGSWEIYWAAGLGSMGTQDAALERETRILALLLQLIETQASLGAVPGTLVFASSAGAIYAGSRDWIVTESSEVAPTTAYAHTKLRQEQMVRAFAQSGERRAALLARLSTLYGPGQSAGKQQGLIGHIARCSIRNQPIQIYVPFDTIRDYITADDAAVAMVRASRCVGGGAEVRVKIIASERPTTIAEIISIFKRLVRRAPRVVTSAGRLTGLYPRRVQFRSATDPCGPRPAGTSLLVGIAQVVAAERMMLARGSHAAPARQ